jgi:hypothetical protein
MHFPLQKYSQPERRALPRITTSNTVISAQRRRQVNADEIETAFSTKSPRVTHDFSQIPLNPPAPANMQANITVNRLGDISEQKVEGLSENVTDVPDVQPPHAWTSLPGAQDAGGQPLPVVTRRRMQRVLGHDFSAVRIHADVAAAGYTDRLGARAATVGGDLFFNQREFRPGTSEGERLIGHELAHVVQQAGGDRQPGGPIDPERAAEAVGTAAAYGAAIPFGLRATPARVPALQPKPASQAPTTQAPTTQAPTTQAPTTQAPTTQAKPAKTWDERLREAQAEPDLVKRGAAMTALAQEALGAAYTVHEAGTTSIASVDTADYAESPAINFDVRLNQKTKHDRKTPVPADDRGYTFSVPTGTTAKSYPIIGPLSLVAGQPIQVKEYADHELYHGAHPAAGELETWTDTFTHYFLPTYLEREAWMPLIKYYEEVVPDTTGAFPPRRAAVAAISTFYQGLSTAPGTDTSKRSDKQRLETWLIRRLHDTNTQNKALIKDLSSALGITAPAKTAAPAPTTP